MNDPPVSPSAPTGPTLGAELERLRAEHRVRRLEQILEVLRARHRERLLAGTAPAPLGEAIAGFAAELSQLRNPNSK